MSGFLPHLPTVILVCMLSLSTSTLLRMTANRATRMYVRLMSNTMDVPETHTRAMTPGRWIRMCTKLMKSLQVQFCKHMHGFTHAYLYLQTCGAGSPHQWWNCCREAGNPLQPIALQSRCHGNGRQGSAPQSLSKKERVRELKAYEITLKLRI